MQTLNQIALSVRDLRRTHQWYVDVFGFAMAGGTEAFKGYLAEKVQGIPGARSSCWWLIDRQDFLQLELFEFERPFPRPLPRDWSRADTGYSTIGIHVSDFDATLARAVRHGSPGLSAAIGEPGRRRVCLRDPDGVLIEVMEDDPRATSPRARPRPELPSVVRYVTLTVPDLSRAREFFVTGMGLDVATGIPLHGPEHEALWGLDGARSESALLWADDLLVELVEYVQPRGRPWPANYCISDRGLLNIAVGFRTGSALRRARTAAVTAGATPNWIMLDLLNWGVVYIDDPQRFSVELLYVRRYWDRAMGFLPALPDRVIERSIDIDASSELVWQHLIDHARLHEWWPCREARLITKGEQGNGPGTVREIRSGWQRLRETVVAWEPGRRLDYRLTAGAPMRRHFGRVELESVSGARCRLCYTIRFCPGIPGTGWVMERLIARMLDQGLGRLQSLCTTARGDQR